MNSGEKVEKKKVLVEYKESEVWKQWENTRFYFSSHGREATRSAQNRRLQLKERKQRKNGDIVLPHPETGKHIGLHTIVAMLFLLPRVLWEHVDNNSHGDCISVIRKINKDTSNRWCDLICINKSVNVTYNFRTHNLEHFNLNEIQLAAKLSWSLFWVRKTTDEEFAPMGVTRNASNIINTSFNWGDGCFQVHKKVVQTVAGASKVVGTVVRHCEVISRCFKRQREYKKQKEIWDVVRELYTDLKTDLKKNKRRRVVEKKKEEEEEKEKETF